MKIISFYFFTGGLGCKRILKSVRIGETIFPDLLWKAMEYGFEQECLHKYLSPTSPLVMDTLKCHGEISLNAPPHPLTLNNILNLIQDFRELSFILNWDLSTCSSFEIHAVKVENECGHQAGPPIDMDMRIGYLAPPTIGTRMIPDTPVIFPIVRKSIVKRIQDLNLTKVQREQSLSPPKVFLPTPLTPVSCGSETPTSLQIPTSLVGSYDTLFPPLAPMTAVTAHVSTTVQSLQSGNSYIGCNSPTTSSGSNLEDDQIWKMEDGGSILSKRTQPTAWLSCLKNGKSDEMVSVV